MSGTVATPNARSTDVGVAEQEVVGRSIAFRSPSGSMRVEPDAAAEVSRAVLSFLDLAATATGRDTYYNASEEQQAAENTLHTAVAAVNPGLYAAILTLPGVNDRAAQIGIAKLLRTPASPSSLVSREDEGKVMAMLLGKMSPPRRFRTLGILADKRINNRRARRLIADAVFSSLKQLPMWAVKYRPKLQDALRHAWGNNAVLGLASYVSGHPSPACAVNLTRWRGLLNRYARRDVDGTPLASDAKLLMEAFAYIMEVEPVSGWTQPMFRMAKAAKADLSAGKTLPLEVLTGIRNRHHKNVALKEVYDQAAVGGGISASNRIRVQKAAERAGSQAAQGFDADASDLVGLYVYALEKGATALPEVVPAIIRKAIEAAGNLPIHPASAAIVIDTSASMAGTAASGKNRPLAVCLAMRDILVAASQASTVWTTAEPDQFVAGSGPSAVNEIVSGYIPPSMLCPAGDSSLALAVANAVATRPEALFLLTDGYENAPEGRTAEVLAQAKQFLPGLAIYQITPVFAAESLATRAIPGAAVLPVRQPEALGLVAIRALLEQDLCAGLEAIMSAANSRLASIADYTPRGIAAVEGKDSE